MQYSLFRIHSLSYVTHIFTLSHPVVNSFCLLPIAEGEKTFHFLLAFSSSTITNTPQDITLIDIFNSRDAFHQFNRFSTFQRLPIAYTYAHICLLKEDEIEDKHPQMRAKVEFFPSFHNFFRKKIKN